MELILHSGNVLKFCLHLFVCLLQLQLLTHAAATGASMQPTASSLSLDKTQSDVIREISPLAGIALLVLLVTKRCPLHVHLCVVVVRMPQEGSKENILQLQTVK